MLIVQKNLFWVVTYTVLAIPVTAGVLYPGFGILLRPEWAGLLMSTATVIVTVNALLINRVRFSSGRQINGWPPGKNA